MSNIKNKIGFFYPLARTLIKKRIPEFTIFIEESLIQFKDWVVNRNKSDAYFMFKKIKIPYISYYPLSFEEFAKYQIFSIILTFARSIEEITKINFKVNRDKIKEVVKKNILKLNAPESVLEDIVSIIQKILDSGEKFDENTKPFALMWTTETEGPEWGEIISEENYKNIVKNKKLIPLLFIRKGVKMEIFIRGECVKLTEGLSRLLEYFLKRRGMGGDIFDIYEGVWSDKYEKNGRPLKELVKEAEKRGKGIKSNAKQKKHEETSFIRKSISQLSKFLYTYFNVKITTFKTGIYRFTDKFEYCLLELLE